MNNKEGNFVTVCIFVLISILIGFGVYIAHLEKENATLLAENTQLKKDLVVAKDIRKVMTVFNCKRQDIFDAIFEQPFFDPKAVAVVAGIESNFRQFAVSSAGCKGLMQMSNVHRLKNPFDVRENINRGALYLRELSLRFGEPKLVLASYNAGPTAVIKNKGVPPYKETLNYIKKFMRFYYI